MKCYISTCLFLLSWTISDKYLLNKVHLDKFLLFKVLFNEVLRDKFLHNKVLLNKFLHNKLLSPSFFSTRLFSTRFFSTLDKVSDLDVTDLSLIVLDTFIKTLYHIQFTNFFCLLVLRTGQQPKEMDWNEEKLAGLKFCGSLFLDFTLLFSIPPSPLIDCTSFTHFPSSLF